MQFGWIILAAAAAVASAAGVVGNTANLARFEPLIGGRWVAEGELGGGRRYTAERRYEWLLDRRFVRLHQQLTVDGVTVQEEVTFGWDAEANQLRMWSVASDGSFAEGRERPAEGENRWVIEGRTVGGRTGEWRITTLIIDPGAFSVLLEVRNGGAFEPAMTLAYRKAADVSPPPDTTGVRTDTTGVGADTSAYAALPASDRLTLAASPAEERATHAPDHSPGENGAGQRRLYIPGAMKKTEPMDQKPRILLTQLSHGAG